MEATGGNGFGNFRAGNHYWDTLGRQREAMDLVTFGLGITTWDTLGTQRQAMDLVTFGLGITTGTAKGKLKGKQKGKLKGKAEGQHAWDATGGNGRQWVW